MGGAGCAIGEEGSKRQLIGADKFYIITRYKYKLMH